MVLEYWRYRFKEMLEMIRESSDMLLLILEVVFVVVVNIIAFSAIINVFDSFLAFPLGFIFGFTAAVIELVFYIDYENWKDWMERKKKDDAKA